eukprot:1762573-Pleurochrysis_carterae.AAC.2
MSTLSRSEMGAFILYVPTLGKRADKLIVERTFAFMRVKGEEVVDVTAQDEPGSDLHGVNPNCWSHGKNAGTAVGAERGIPRWGVTVHDLVCLEITLEVGCDEIPSAHAHARGVSDGGQRSKRCGSHRGTESLIIVNSMDLGAALNTQSRFERAATLVFVHPDEPNDGAIRGDVGAVHERPAPVLRVVIDLGTFGAAPANAVLGHGLLAGAWVSGCAPVLRPHMGLSGRARVRRRAEVWRDRRGYEPRVRWKCVGVGVGGCCDEADVGEVDAASGDGASDGVDVSQRVTVERVATGAIVVAGGVARGTGGRLVVAAGVVTLVVELAVQCAPITLESKKLMSGG